MGEGEDGRLSNFKSLTPPSDLIAFSSKGNPEGDVVAQISAALIPIDQVAFYISVAFARSSMSAVSDS